MGRYCRCCAMVFDMANSLTASPFFICCANLASFLKSTSPSSPTSAVSASIYNKFTVSEYNLISNDVKRTKSHEMHYLLSCFFNTKDITKVRTCKLPKSLSRFMHTLFLPNFSHKTRSFSRNYSHV